MLTLSVLGDSKSTSQKLGDEGRSVADSAQDTFSDLSNKASENTPSSAGDAQGTAKSYLSSAQDTASDLTNKASENAPSTGEAQGAAKSYLQQAQDTASDLANKASANAPSSGEAQEGAKSYIETAQKYASDAAKTVSDTVSGPSLPALLSFSAAHTHHITDIANQISESGSGKK